MAKLTNPATMDEAAASFAHHEKALQAMAADLKVRRQRTWLGARAEAYTRHHEARIRHVEDYLGDLGRARLAATQAAAELRQELALLRKFEIEVRARLAASGVPATDLPPSGDTAWRDLHRSIVGLAA